jgi:hypothetical protein
MTEKLAELFSENAVPAMPGRNNAPAARSIAAR